MRVLALICVSDDRFLQSTNYDHDVSCLLLVGRDLAQRLLNVLTPLKAVRIRHQSGSLSVRLVTCLELVLPDS